MIYLVIEMYKNEDGESVSQLSAYSAMDEEDFHMHVGGCEELESLARDHDYSYTTFKVNVGLNGSIIQRFCYAITRCCGIKLSNHLASVRSLRADQAL